jgi:hypothetical protein
MTAFGGALPLFVIVRGADKLAAASTPIASRAASGGLRFEETMIPAMSPEQAERCQVLWTELKRIPIIRKHSLHA